MLHAACQQIKQSVSPEWLLACRDAMAASAAACALQSCSSAVILCPCKERCQPGKGGLKLFCLLQASRIAEHGGSPPSDPLALAQACGLAMLLQRRPLEELPSGVHLMLEAVTSHQRIVAPQHSGALLRLEAPSNAGATLGP